MLRRLMRDASMCGKDLARPAPEPPEQGAVVCPASKLLYSPVRKEKSKATHQNHVVFEDLDFVADENPKFAEFVKLVAEWIFGQDDDSREERCLFEERACLLHDDVMALILESGTEVIHRIRLEPTTKTVQEGALWTEEALPVETILGSVVTAVPVKQRETGQTPEASDLLSHTRKLAESNPIQLGGNASVGRGLCRVRLEG
jgi:CRISPR-associated protein Cmr4